MSKTTYTTEEYIRSHEFTRNLGKAVVTFMLFPVVTMAAPAAADYRSEIDVKPVVETVMAGRSVTLNQVITANTTSDMAAEAFNSLTARIPEAVEMEAVADFITEGIGDIDVEHVVMDCDRTSKVLNVAYRLPGDILLSVNKPQDTMDDEYVMFNVYHLRELLVSDTARIDLLAQYIRNVEKRIKEQA